MPDQDSPTSDGELGPPWDALEVLKGRAAEAKARRDASISELRKVMTDDAVLDEFGIDLSRLEP